LDINAHSFDFGVVAHEVLHRDCDIVGLDALNVGGSKCARQLGVFAVTLERAAADRRAMQVDVGAEKNVGSLAASLDAEE
jgi:hypothetical protein